MGIALTLKLASGLEMDKSSINRLTFVASGDETDSEALNFTRTAFQDGEERLYYRPRATTTNLTLLVSAWQSNRVVAEGSTGNLTINPAALTQITVTLARAIDNSDMNDMGSADAASSDMPADLLTQDQIPPLITFASPATFHSGGLSPVALAPGRLVNSPELPRGSAILVDNKAYLSTRGCQIGTGSPSLDVGSLPVAIAAGDFNRDGWDDFAVVNNNSGSVSVLLSDGAGTGGFHPPDTYSVGTTPVDIAIADFNGDSNLDWATANGGSHSVTIYHGDAAGKFMGGPTITGISGEQNAIAAGDLFRVTKPVLRSPNPDIVVATDTGLHVYYDNGASYDEMTAFESDPVAAVKVANLDNDGRDEIVALVSGQTQTHLNVYVNFQLLPDANGFKGATRFVLEDFNRDGRLDAAVGLSIADIRIFSGVGDGSFLYSSTVPLDGAASALATAEFVSATLGKKDLIVLAGSDCIVFANTSP